MDLGIEGLEDATQLGSGGFGTVYRARQVRLNRTVAVKILPQTGGDETAELRFQREAAALGTLATHPNIVTVYDSGLTARGEPYLIMELMSRGSLADQIINEGPAAWARVLEIGVGLAGALASAHAAGILHRDIKPANVLLSDFDEPVLADFGIARMEGAGQTQSAGITGSAAHLAPELLHGQPPSEASDVYALGSTLFHVLAGTPAFVRSTDQTIAAAYQRILTAPVPDLRPNGVPDEICTAIERLLQKDPGERPATAVEAGELLRDLQRQAGLDATPLLVRQADAGAVAAVAATPDDATGVAARFDAPTTDATVTGAPASRPAAHDTGTDAEARPLRKPTPDQRDRVQKKWLIAGGVVAPALLVALVVSMTGGGGNDPVATPGATSTTEGTTGETTSSTAPASGDLANATLYGAGPCDSFVAPGGSGDGTADAPYGSVEEMLTNLPIGGVGCMLGGTYPDDVTIDASMTGVEGTLSSLGSVAGHDVAITGNWIIESDGAHLQLSDVDFVGNGPMPPLDVRSQDVQIWYSSFTNPDGPCMDVVGDVAGSLPVTLTGVMFHDCGTADVAALRLGGDAMVTASSLVFDSGGDGGTAIDVGATGAVVLTFATFVDHRLAAAIREAAETEDSRLFSLTNSIIVGVSEPPIVSAAGAEGGGLFSLGPNCLQPASGVDTAAVMLRAENFSHRTTLPGDLIGEVVFRDRAGRDYGRGADSGCGGFGAQADLLDLREGGW